MPTMGREANISPGLFAKENTSTNLPDDAISFLKALRVPSHFIHLAGHVTAEDGGPLLDEDAGVLHMAVERVDGDGSILHDELAGTGRGQWGVAHLQGGVSFDEPCGLILRCRHSFFLSFFSSFPLSSCLCGWIKKGGRARWSGKFEG